MLGGALTASWGDPHRDEKDDPHHNEDDDPHHDDPRVVVIKVMMPVIKLQKILFKRIAFPSTSWIKPRNVETLFIVWAVTFMLSRGLNVVVFDHHSHESCQGTT